MNSVTLLHLLINKISGYFEEINGNKYLILVPTDMSKEIMKMYEELWSKIRDIIRSIANDSGNYYKKYIKFKFNLDVDFPLKKKLVFHNMIIPVRAVSYEDNK